MVAVSNISKGTGPFYCVYLSDGESLKISEDTLVRYHLFKGQELEEETIQKIKESSIFDFFFQQALDYLSYHLRSEKEIRTYLKKKNINLTDINKIVDRLKELELINDLVYGESYVRTNMRLSDKGPKELVQQMKQKGLSSDVIEQALLQYTFENQVKIAKKIAEKLLGKNYGRSQKELLRKIQQTLITKGFMEDVIQSAVDVLPKEIHLEKEYDHLVKQGEKLWKKNIRFDIFRRKMKVKQILHQKGFSLDMIQQFIEEKEEELSE